MKVLSKIIIIFVLLLIDMSITSTALGFISAPNTIENYLGVSIIISLVLINFLTIKKIFKNEKTN